MSEENPTPQPYEDFERDWKKSHKADLPRRIKTSSVREFFWILFWIVVASGAAIFSAAHTIPAAEMTILKSVVQRSALAITAFVIVELVIFGAAAMRRDIKWLGWLLWGAIFVALVGNISSSIRAVAENGGDAFNQVGGVLLSIIAPLTAFAAGEVLHIQLDKRNTKNVEAQADYDQKYKEMEAKIRTAYTRYLKEFKAEFSRKFMKSREAEEVHEVSRSIHETPKPRVKLHEVAREIHEAGDSKLSAAEMMAKYQIGLGSTTKIREILTTNGFGEH